MRPILFKLTKLVVVKKSAFICFSYVSDSPLNILALVNLINPSVILFCRSVDYSLSCMDWKVSPVSQAKAAEP